MSSRTSPGGHCRQFAPTYEKLALQSKHMEETRGLFLGQINCQAQGGGWGSGGSGWDGGQGADEGGRDREVDLCNEHEIKYCGLG